MGPGRLIGGELAPFPGPPYAVRIEMMKKSSNGRRLGIESMVAMNPKQKTWGDAVGREMDKETPLREVSASLPKTEAPFSYWYVNA
jgi:hypothetical protein